MHTNTSKFFIFKTPETDEEEHLKYGVWSPVAMSLGLPSYRASFIFLMSVPLEVIYEFLRMRLEQKPENPSPLSVRQLIRELKEGIKVAVKHRQKTVIYVNAAFNEQPSANLYYLKYMSEFDASLANVFKLYLQYVEEWCKIQGDPFQKHFLEEEWNFICEYSSEIPNSENLAGIKFCTILQTLMISIGDRLRERVDDLAAEMKPKDDTVLTK